MMPSEHDVIEQYLLVYDRARGVQVSAEPVGTDAASASDAYRAAERMYQDRPKMDVLLVGSDSLDSVKRTHSTYFQSVTSKDIDALVASLVA